MVHRCSHGSDKEYLRILDKTMVEMARKRNLAMTVFKKQANSRVKVGKQAVIPPGYSKAFLNVSFLPILHYQ